MGYLFRIMFWHVFWHKCGQNCWCLLLCSLNFAVTRGKTLMSNVLTCCLTWFLRYVWQGLWHISWQRLRHIVWVIFRLVFWRDMLFGNLDVICSMGLANIRAASRLHMEALGSVPEASTGSLAVLYCASLKGPSLPLWNVCMSASKAAFGRYHECCARAVRGMVLVFGSCAPHVLWGVRYWAKVGWHDVIGVVRLFE